MITDEWIATSEIYWKHQIEYWFPINIKILTCIFTNSFVLRSTDVSNKLIQVKIFHIKVMWEEWVCPFRNKDFSGNEETIGSQGPIRNSRGPC